MRQEESGEEYGQLVGGDPQARQVGSQFKQLALEVLSRWHWLSLGLMFGILGGFYYFSKAPRIYQATATLLVTQDGSSIVPGVRESGDLDLRSSEGLNTLAVRIKRPEFLTKVAAQEIITNQPGLIPPKVNWFPEWSRGWLGGENEVREDLDPRQLDPVRLARLISSWTSVNIVENTRLLDINVTHPVPEVASVLANTIAIEYEKELSDDRSSGLNSSSAVLDNESADLGEAIQEKENALASYKTALVALSALKTEENRFAELDRRYKPKHPKHIDARVALEDKRKRFLEEFESVRTSPFDKSYWEGRREELTQTDLDEIGRVRIARRLLTARETILNNEISSQKSVFSELKTQSLKSKADLANNAIGVEKSSLSEVPGAPFSPLKGQVLTKGALTGFGSALFVVMLLVKLDNKVHTILQVETLTHLPVLATIRKVDPKLLNDIVDGKGESAALEGTAAEKWDPRVVFRPGLSETVFAEMFRILRASVSLLGSEEKRSTTLFSSALPGEGKTMVSFNFALASAQQGKRTLLLDFDLRRPAVHKMLGLKRSELGPGLTEVLAGQISLEKALTEDTGQENLTCILAGKKAPNPGELLNTESISKLISGLRKDFDVLVIDSAPLLAVSDTRLLISEVDNFCLVIRADQTPKGAIRKVIDILGDDGTEPAGIVFNGYEEKAGLLTRKYQYGYGYGGYGQYGKGYGSGGYGTYGSDEDD